MGESLWERRRERRHELKRQRADTEDCPECGHPIRRGYIPRHFGKEHPLEWAPWWPDRSSSEANDHVGIWECQRRRMFDEYGEECLVCGGTNPQCESGRVDAHHYKPRDDFAEEMFAHGLDNLIPLCASCHRTLEYLSEERQRAVATYGPFDFGGEKTAVHQASAQKATKPFTSDTALRCLVGMGGSGKTGEIADALGWANSTVKKYLGGLESEGVVSSEFAGRAYLWTVNDD